VINAIGADWQTHLGNVSPPTDRIYSDFRLLEYPDLETGSAVYSLAREDNLIDRGNCESTTAPMIFDETVAPLNNATWARSSDFSHTGDYSYKYTKTNAAGGAGPYVGMIDALVGGDMHGMVAGQVIDFSCWVYIPTASGMGATEAGIIIRDIDGGAVQNNTVLASSSLDGWHELSGTHTISDDAQTFYILVTIAAAAAINEYFYIDDIKLTTHNIPGSHYLSSGYTEHLLEMPDTFTMQIKFLPTFAHTTANNESLWEWYIDSTHFLRIFYGAGSDKFNVSWKDGTNQRNLQSVQYDGGSSHRNINQHITMTVAFDSTTGDTTGSALWMNKTQDDAAWDGAIDAKSSEFNKALLRRTASLNNTGAFDIAYVRFFSGLVATDAQVQADFKDVKNEEIFFSLDGHGTGRSRCNITRFVSSITTTKQVENLLSGSQGANRCGIRLFNRDADGQGYFSDDQYAAFDPTADIFNGTVNQKYLQRRSNVTIENWYDGDFDTVFFGKVNSSLYKRSTQDQTYGTVAISCDDNVGLIARTSVEKGRYYEDADLVDTADESDSLLHIITRLATERQIPNFLSNSSFENATIANSWLVTAGGTLNRDAADGFFGSASGELIPGAATEDAFQDVTFSGSKKLNVGEVYNFSILVKSTVAASGANNSIYLMELLDGTYRGDSSQLYTLTGGEGYTKVDISRTISFSDSNRLRVIVRADAGDTINIDGAMLIRGDRALNYFVLNSNDGVAGVSSADDEVSAGYDTLGFDVESVAITHRWRRVDENVSLWQYLKDIADSTVASYIGLNSAGSFRFRSRLATAYGDPVPMGTLSTTRGIGTTIDLQRKNKIVVHGVSIVKNVSTTVVWNATSSHAFPLTDDGTIAEDVLAAGIWPDPDTYGESFIARYGDNDKVERTSTILDTPIDDTGAEPYDTFDPTFWDKLRIWFERSTSASGLWDQLKRSKEYKDSKP